MEGIELQANPRSVTGKQVKRLRQEGFIPAIIYGYGIDPISVKFEAVEFSKAVSKAGTSTAVQVHVEGESEPLLAIFRDVQYDPIRRSVIHADLQALNVKETVRVPVSIVLVGQAPAVEEQGAVLLQVLNEVEIEALPTALIPFLEIDVTGLTEIGQSIAVGDIDTPEGVTILTSPDETVAQITYIEEVTEEEEEALEEAPLSLGEVEVIGRGKEEEEGEGEGEAVEE